MDQIGRCTRPGVDGGHSEYDTHQSSNENGYKYEYYSALHVGNLVFLLFAQSEITDETDIIADCLMFFGTKSFPGALSLSLKVGLREHVSAKIVAD